MARVKKIIRPSSGVQVARRLGLSHATVSYALNGKGEEKGLTPATIKRVLDEAKRMNYAPMPFARSLVTRRSGMISVILPNFRNDWAELVIEGLEKVFDATDFAPFVAIHQFDDARNRRELLSFLKRRDNGLITLPTMNCTELYREIAEAGTPMVFIGDEVPTLHDAVSSVMWDPSEGIRSVVDHLVGTGRKRIAFLGMDYPGLGTVKRFNAFVAALDKHGLRCEKELVSKPPLSLCTEAIVNVSLDQFFRARGGPPDAIFALHDSLALPALEALRQRDVPVPEEVALVGMGDYPLARHTAIGLSSIPEPNAEMAAIAARLLLDLMEGRAEAPVHRTVQTSEFIARRSMQAASMQNREKQRR